MQNQLTAVQRAIYDYLWAFWTEHGTRPTLKQIAEAAGLRTHGAVPYHMGRIVIAGFALPSDATIETEQAT